nr:alanine racemase [Acidimicrobiia bacterium]
ALAHPAARRGMVRAGIAVYGIAPGPSVDHLCRDLRPALSLRARVAAVRRVAAGERVSYGLHHTFPVATTLATVPIGYADGVRRGLWPGGELLVGGKRRPIVGVVTMDQLMVDCADDEVAPGDEVVLIGSQGGERITAADWARHLGTIAYEVTTGISARVPRHVVRTP